MWRWESWSIKKAEHWRANVFKFWCWRRLLRIPWTARWSNTSILKEISPEYSLKGLMLKLKLPYFSHLMWRTNSLEKTMMPGKIEGKRRRAAEDEMVDGIIDSMNMGLSKLQETEKDREAWHATIPGVTKNWAWLSDRTTTRRIWNSLLCS